jgi:hypothetical protein
LLSQNYSYNDIKKILPTVFSLFDESATVTPQQLKEFYQTESVVVEDDQAGIYATFNNQQKMRYKINACNQLMQKHRQLAGKHYDLVIRLRPDLEFHATKDTDWMQIADICNSKKVIFIDWSVGLGNLADGGEYGTGDVVAIGSQTSMDFYAGVVSELKEVFVEQGMTHYNAESTHVLLANGLWAGGHSSKSLPLAKGKFISTSLKTEEILKAIQNDLANLDKKVADNLVNALEQDILDEK